MTTGHAAWAVPAEFTEAEIRCEVFAPEDFVRTNAGRLGECAAEIDREGSRQDRAKVWEGSLPIRKAAGEVV